MSIARIQ